MHYISDRQRVLSVKQKKETEQKHKEVSVLSNSSSSSTVTDGPSCNRVRIGKRSWKCVKVGLRRKASSAELTRLRFRGESILELLSRGCASEVRIRAALGDSPDTSKALRMWLSLSLSLQSCTRARHTCGLVYLNYDMSMTSKSCNSQFKYKIMYNINKIF